MQIAPQILPTEARLLKAQYAEALRERALRHERARQADKGEPLQLGGLIHFVRYFWGILEPSRRLVEGPVLHAICMHLEAVTRGEIRRILINVSPGSMKSLLVNVFWPAWEWSAGGMPHLRYISFSYASTLTERDNGRMRDLIQSRQFQELWGSTFGITEDGRVKLANNKTGWKFASSVRGVGTGERADRCLLDDPHNIKDGESEAIRGETVRWFREAMSNRLNDLDTSVIVVIMQRVHEDDVSGSILEPDAVGATDGIPGVTDDYDHLCIPNEFEAARYKIPTTIGWLDWRTSEGELAWPERISALETARLKSRVGPYAYAGQYQQSPEPRGGGIFKRDWWGVYQLDGKGKPLLPPHYIVASLDPAYGKKQENDPSGFTIWGVFKDTDGYPKVSLLYAWQKFLELHGVDVERQKNEPTPAYVERAKLQWGLVEWVAHDCKRMQVDLLLIESKASGLSVYQEIRRLYRAQKWGVQLVDPGALDKRTRAYAIQHLFSDRQVFAPERDWAEMVIKEFAKFRGLDSDKDNLVDAGTQALKHLRDTGLLLRRDERLEDERDRGKYVRPLEPLYPDV